MKVEVLLLVSMIAILFCGVAIGWGFGSTVSPTAPVTVATSTSSSKALPLSIAMPEIMGNAWNSSGVMQPKFLVEGGDGFLSSANISFPAHRLIQLTIVSYDTPTPNSTAAEAKVTGTVGGVVYMINGTLASASSMSTGMPSSWGQNVTSVAASSLAHTFTIPMLGINIPVVGGSTVIAYLYFDKPGTYTWICLTPCGFGKGGLSGAMATAGWMTGTLTVR
jgi:heme/copper-type cytochrome/quinol oxidase subunit 2